MKRKIIMVTNSVCGTKGVAIFEFPIKLISLNDNDFEIQSEFCEGRSLEPIGTFFEQIPCETYLNPSYVDVVSACLVGSELYMFPHDNGKIKSLDKKMKVTQDKFPTVNPIVFHLPSKTEKRCSNLPKLQARKIGPILTFVGQELFALSAYFSPYYTRAPQPCFEALNLYPSNPSSSWRALRSAPFNEKAFFLEPDHSYRVTGYAVLGSDFLLVSLVLRLATLFYTYNFRSNMWNKTNPVLYEDYTERRSTNPFSLQNQAVVIDHDIYTVIPWTLELVVFSYDELEAGSSYAGYDISLSAASIVQGFCDYPQDISSYPTAAIAKVNNAVFCLLFTQTPQYYVPSSEVIVVFTQLKGRGLCETIKSFTCNLSLGTELSEIYLQSCHVMGDVEEKQEEAYYDFDDKAAAADCGSSGENKETPLFETAIVL